MGKVGPLARLGIALANPGDRTGGGGIGPRSISGGSCLRNIVPPSASTTGPRTRTNCARRFLSVAPRHRLTSRAYSQARAARLETWREGTSLSTA